MGEITAGVVAVNTFCKADSKYFAGYIGYMDRDEAIRKEHIKEFDLFTGYMGYMGNHRKTLVEEEPEKISGLFTANSDLSEGKEIQDLKEVYKRAQDKGSMMWQTVLSFDNEWLNQMGIYDKETGALDEKRFKQAVRRSVITLQEKEALQNSVWSGAIHYNTDNIHVHIAMVEPEPARKKKLYKQYEVVQINGKWQYRMVANPETGRKERVPLCDADGKIIEKEEYIGKFKESSLKAMKSTMVEQLSNDKEINIRINTLIRDEIVNGAKNYELYNDEEFRNAFMDIYHRLPEDKRLCNYGNNIMQPLRADIDELSKQFIEKYYKEQYDEVLSLIFKQAERYKIAYGGDENQFFEKKVDDIFYRLGNAILAEMKELAKKEAAEDVMKEGAESFEQSDTSEEALNFDMTDDKRGHSESQRISRKIFVEGVYMSWEPDYKEARNDIYERKNMEAATRAMLQLADNGNVLAMYEAGNIYRFGRGVDIDPEKAHQYYEKALEGFKTLEHSGEYIKFKGYLNYRIGKQYYHGMGTEQNFETSAQYFIRSEEVSEKGNIYAEYLLGNQYSKGDGVPMDTDMAVMYYEKSADGGNAYAQYRMGQIYEKGEWVKENPQQSYEYYKEALHSFELIKEKDDNMFYRLGSMYLKGKGTTIDMPKAIEYLSQAAELGNDMAMYQIGKVFVRHGTNAKMVKDGIAYLNASAEKGNIYAAYELGEVYRKNGSKKEAEEWYIKSAAGGNEYAAARLHQLKNKSNSAFLQSLRYESIKNQRNLKSALYWLQRSMKNVMENVLNQKDYEELQREISADREVQWKTKDSMEV